MKPHPEIQRRLDGVAEILQGFTDGIDGERLMAAMDFVRSGATKPYPKHLIYLFASVHHAAKEEAGWKGDPVKAAITDIDQLMIPMTASPIDDIAAERTRQIEVEGWTPEHDDQRNSGSLGDAAAAYAISDEKHSFWLRHGANLWPWGGSAKRTERRRDLVKAGALIVAEIDRIDRAASKGGAA